MADLGFRVEGVGFGVFGLLPYLEEHGTWYLRL